MPGQEKSTESRCAGFYHIPWPSQVLCPHDTIGEEQKVLPPAGVACLLPSCSTIRSASVHRLRIMLMLKAPAGRTSYQRHLSESQKPHTHIQLRGQWCLVIAIPSFLVISVHHPPSPRPVANRLSQTRRDPQTVVQLQFQPANIV